MTSTLVLSDKVNQMSTQSIIIYTRENILHIKHTIKDDISSDINVYTDLLNQLASKYLLSRVLSGFIPISVIEFVIKYYRQHISKSLGCFIIQQSNVIDGLLKSKWVFEHRATSTKLKALAKAYPAVVHLVESFLCGPGFHCRPPPLHDAAAYRKILAALALDALRDQRHRVALALPRRRFRRVTPPFEQLLFFLALRRGPPVPMLAACAAGNAAAVVLLGGLGFPAFPDSLWPRHPALQARVGGPDNPLGGLRIPANHLLRQLNIYYSR